jgi:hypothetical protein
MAGAAKLLGLLSFLLEQRRPEPFPDLLKHMSGSKVLCDGMVQNL